MTEAFSRIRAKIVARGLSLNPPTTETEAEAFESRHGISLPGDYRRFITTIGNGGPGPVDYGVLPLGGILDELPSDEIRYWTELPDIRKPFPFTRYWLWEEGGVSEEGTREQVQHGSILLGTDGCGMNWHLIVSGHDVGMLWQFTGEGILPSCPKRSFSQWFEDWLDGKGSFYGLSESGA